MRRNSETLLGWAAILAGLFWLVAFIVLRSAN